MLRFSILASILTPTWKMPVVLMLGVPSWIQVRQAMPDRTSRGLITTYARPSPIFSRVPFATNEFDAAMNVLSLHHWNDQRSRRDEESRSHASHRAHVCSSSREENLLVHARLLVGSA